MRQGDGLEEFLQGGYTDKAVVRHAPVRSHCRQSGEWVESNLLCILSGICSHKCRNKHVAAHIVDGSYSIGVETLAGIHGILQESSFGICGSGILRDETPRDGFNVAEELVEG